MNWRTIWWCCKNEQMSKRNLRIGSIRILLTSCIDFLTYYFCPKRQKWLGFEKEGGGKYLQYMALALSQFCSLFNFRVIIILPTLGYQVFILHPLIFPYLSSYHLESGVLHLWINQWQKMRTSNVALMSTKKDKMLRILVVGSSIISWCKNPILIYCFKKWVH